MSRQPASAGGRADTAEYKQELLGRLGLQADASDQEVEAAHNGLVEFLELAPHEVRLWAQSQTADVDEAFALLSGPEKELVPPTGFAATAQDAPSGLSVAAPVLAPAAPAQPAPVTPATLPAPASAWLPAALAGNKALQKKIALGAAAVLVVGIGVGVYFNGQSSVPGISGTPTGQATQASGTTPTATPVDPAKVSALMVKISANPKDIVSLQALGDLYFGAQDYKNASLWEEKVLAIDPKNQVALLAAGAAQFNVANPAGAKKQWLIAAALYPKNQEVHYDLGFLYMSATPPDSANMQAEWKKVVAIDPNSNLAKTVATHLQSSTATPSAAPSAK
jgi:tetratricopeptide (TPR) repeat protein